MSSIVLVHLTGKKEENKVITQNFEIRFGFMKETTLRRSQIPLWFSRRLKYKWEKINDTSLLVKDDLTAFMIDTFFSVL